MQEIQGAALGRKQRAGIGEDRTEYLLGCDALAVGGAPGDFGTGIEFPDAAVEPVPAAEYAGLAGYHGGPRHALVRNQAGGEVAGANVFGEGAGDVAGDFCGKRVIKIDGHG